MERELDIEYCKLCEDIYAVRAVVWLYFNDVEGETFHSSEDTAYCPRCYHPMRRYDGYLEALRKRESEEFIEDTLAVSDDLSGESLVLLREFLQRFSVPSFSVMVKGDARPEVAELEKKRYVTVDRINGNERSIISLNAYKLNLLDNKPLLLETNNQQSFITNPGYLRDDNRHGLRRKARLEAMVNDFTDSDKIELIDKFDGKCALTGKDVSLQIDHVIPVAVGHGGTTKANMLPIWQRINSSKSDRNIFEWYEENGARFEVVPELFDKAIEYLAEFNGMSAQEYRDYVYECHANPNDILTEVI